MRADAGGKSANKNRRATHIFPFVSLFLFVVFAGNIEMALDEKAVAFGRQILSPILGIDGDYHLRVGLAIAVSFSFSLCAAFAASASPSSQSPIVIGFSFRSSSAS